MNVEETYENGHMKSTLEQGRREKGNRTEPFKDETILEGHMPKWKSMEKNDDIQIGKLKNNSRNTKLPLS